METFTEFRPMVVDQHYNDRRRQCLSKLTISELDAPIAGLIRDLCGFPFCFTIQSCFGHFLYSGQENPINTNPLPTAGIQTVEYRIAYLAVCIENSRSGQVFLHLLKQLPEIAPLFIQFGCAEWFWERYPNSYVVQVEPERHKFKDTCMIDSKAVPHLETVRNELYDHLKMLIAKISAGIDQSSTCNRTAAGINRDPMNFLPEVKKIL